MSLRGVATMNVFLSYRRDDSQYRARLIYDALTKALCAIARHE